MNGSTQVQNSVAAQHKKGWALMRIFVKISAVPRYAYIAFSLCLSCGWLHTICQERAQADSADYYKADYFRYEDRVYMEGIASVLLHRAGWPLSDPLIELNKGDRLLLSFDDLRGYLRDFGYTIIHCDAAWRPSNLLAAEYISGLPEDYIVDYKYSRNTRQKYVHYSLSIPNDNMTPAISGNYLLKVYLADQPDSLVLSRRFMVFESKVDVTARIGPASTVSDRFYKQEVDFNIRWDKYMLSNPYQDLHVVLMQNHRWDNAITGLQPVFVKDRELVYDFDRDNVFPGGNEFRFFDIKDLRYQSEGIDSIRRGRENHVYLEPDVKRSFKVYLDKPDINGRRFIKTDDRFTDSEVDADYTWVHFYLEHPGPLLSGDIYVFGELTGWHLSREGRMKYDTQKRMYSCALYLKKGYYNYAFALSTDRSNAPDLTALEGSHYEAENEYSILVYHRQVGGSYDRLVAAETFSTKKKN
ncbi:MAG: DUF5103 domain-containing protein [Flavobacteriales bacterium]